MQTEKRVQFSKFDKARQLVYGEVYVPNVPDSQGDFMTAEEIERIAHNFLKKGAVLNIDTEHNLELNGSTVVESFIAREGDPDFVPGSWVMGVHVAKKDVWQKVVSGEINGFSMYGSGRREPADLEFDIPDDGIVKGETSASADHVHRFMVKFDEKGAFLGGETDEVAGHKHLITKGTATERAGLDKHSHRFNFIDAILKSQTAAARGSLHPEEVTSIAKYSPEQLRAPKGSENGGQWISATSTPEFKAWFSGSKVVNPDGSPRVVYHGTASDFESFDPATIGRTYGLDDHGFYFTSRPDLASGYAGAAGARSDDSGVRFEGSNVVPVYLALKNPWIINVDTSQKSPIAHFEGGEGQFDRGQRNVVQYGVDSGYDGIIIRDPKRPNGEEMYIAFRPEQIKSSVGNRGTFDSKDPSLTKWDESQVNRGKTKPGTNEGSFAPKASGQQKIHEIYDSDEENRKLLIDKLMEDAKVDLKDPEDIKNLERLGGMMAAGVYEFTAEEQSLLDQVPEDLRDAVKEYLIAKEMDSLISEKTGMESLAESARQQLGLGDDDLTRLNPEWSESLDNYIGSGYEEINGSFRSMSEEQARAWAEDNWDQEIYDQTKQEYIDEHIDAKVEELKNSGDYTLPKREDFTGDSADDDFEWEMNEVLSGIRTDAEDQLGMEAEDRAKDYAIEYAKQTKLESFGNPHPDAEQIQELIDSRPPTPVAMITKRGVKSGKSIDWDNRRVGDTFELQGFTSSSSKSRVASSFGQRRIVFVVPKGSKDVLFTTNDSEGEIIFNHGARVRVLAVNSQQMILAYDPRGNEPDDSVEKADKKVPPEDPPQTLTINFGRMLTEPTITHKLKLKRKPLEKWDESKHPRHPAGSAMGGQFAPAHNVTGPLYTSLHPDRGDAARLSEHFRAQGIEALGGIMVPPEKMHATLVYSFKPLPDYVPSKDGFTIDPSQMRMLLRSKPGKETANLSVAFDSPAMRQKYAEAMGMGMDSGGKTFDPHITLAYGVPKDLDLSKFKLPGFSVRLGAEHAEPLDTSWKHKLKKWNEEDHPRHPAGDSRGGEFAPSGRPTTASGWLIPRKGDKVFQPVRGFGGATAMIHGEVYGPPSKLRVRVTGSASMVGSAGTGKTYPLTSHWIVDKDPKYDAMLREREEREKAKETEFRNSMDSYRNKGLATVAEDLARGHSPLTDQTPLKSKVVVHEGGNRRTGIYDEKGVFSGKPSFFVNGRSVQPEFVTVPPLKKWDEEDHPRHPAGSEQGGEFAPKGVAMVSPSVTDVDFDGAVSAMSGERHRLIGEALTDLKTLIGIRPSKVSVLGTWKDGAENTYMLTFPAGASEIEQETYAAMAGYIANQKAVLNFTPDVNGEGRLYSFDVSGKSPAEVQKALLTNGVEYSTLINTRGGVRAVMYSDKPNPELSRAIKQAAESLGSTRGTISAGRGKFLGDPDWSSREVARREYEAVIERNFGLLRRRDGIDGWRRFRDTRTQALDQVTKAEPPPGFFRQVLQSIAKYVPWQARWPEGTKVDASGVGGGRWAPSSVHSGYHFPKGEDGKPMKGEVWRDAQGRPASAEIVARLKAAGVSAAYSNVVLNEDPTAPNIAIGIDAKGREKRFYSPEFHEGQAAKKFDELRTFNKVLPDLRQKVEQQLETATGKDKIAAQVLYILDQTGYRIGGGEDELADNDAFGITTLTASHVKVNGDSVSFSFPGKKGVQLTKTIEDARLAAIVTEAKANASRGQPLFPVSGTKVNNTLKDLSGGNFSAKDYRTWHGTAVAIIEMNKWKTPPRTPKELKERQSKVLEKVSSWLGNTPAVAKSSYVDPGVWSWWTPKEAK